MITVLLESDEEIEIRYRDILKQGKSSQEPKKQKKQQKQPDK